jgi:hypothetical protein
LEKFEELQSDDEIFICYISPDPPKGERTFHPDYKELMIDIAYHCIENTKLPIVRCKVKIE